MRRPEKSSKLIDYIERGIVSGQFPPNARLPGIRQLADKFRISYNTALRGIDFLCEQGKLEKIPQKGIFVRENRMHGQEPRAKRIAVFMEPHVTERHIGLCYTAFLGMQEQASKVGYTFMLNPILVKDISVKYIKEMSVGAEGIILLNEYDLVLEDFDVTLPTVGMLVDNSFGGIISTVNINPYSAAKEAVKFFELHGVRQVTIVSSRKPVYVTRGKIFDMMWKEKGYTCDWSFSVREEVNFRKEYGYFFTSDHRAQSHFESYFKHTGRKLTDDYVLLGIDGKQFTDPSFYRFPSIVIDWKTMGKVAFNECVDRINHPGRIPMNIMLDGKLIVPTKSCDDRYAGKEAASVGELVT